MSQNVFLKPRASKCHTQSSVGWKRARQLHLSTLPGGWVWLLPLRYKPSRIAPLSSSDRVIEAASTG